MTRPKVSALQVSVPRVVSLLFVFLFAFSGVGRAQWVESASAHYTVRFQPGYEDDAAFTQRWMDRAEQLMKEKYGVTPEPYRMSVYLHPMPTAEADVGRALNRCCTAGPDRISTGTIDLLAPSSPAWKQSDYRSSLGLSKSSEDYHAKILMSEYIPIGHYAVQDARPSGGWRYYDAPEWFVQGLQEYDAIFHTTPTNRVSTSGRLFAWARSHPATFACCSPTLTIDEAYNGGATFMAFLAAEFGEAIHAQLLRDPAPTFAEAFANETKPYTMPELFQRFHAWLARTAAQ